MPIRIRYLGLVYRASGLYEEIIYLDTPIPISALLEIVFERHPEVMKLIYVEGGLNPLYRILLNGRDIEHLEGLNTKVYDGDVVTFSSPFGG
ncbi:MAG TPA: molybdopterin synthase sulfur carrier subunit [Thermoprotei archaeon]|nr:molybdopterin synthase sulfur carrier subunit [Thermoprotei archaeon]